MHLGHREFDRLQKEYDALTDEQKEELGYERVLYDVLASLIHRMDRNIAMNKKTVEKENQPRPIKPVDQSRLDSLKQQETGAPQRDVSRAVVSASKPFYRPPANTVTLNRREPGALGAARDGRRRGRLAGHGGGGDAL